MTAVDTQRDPAAGLGEVLAVLREHALALGAEAAPPSRVRLEAAGVVLELDWSAPARPQDTHAPAVDPLPLPQRNGALQPLPPARAAHTPQAETPTQAPDHRVTAPTVGVFYRAPEPGAQHFVAVGDAVVPGQQMAIIEAMKLMIPVEADRAGRVVEVLCADGEPVEFGQPLFVLADGG